MFLISPLSKSKCGLLQVQVCLFIVSLLYHHHETIATGNASVEDASPAPSGGVAIANQTIIDGGDGGANNDTELPKQRPKRVIPV